MTTQIIPISATNDQNAISDRYTQKRLSWFPVIVFLPWRFLFALLAKSIMVGVLWIRGVPDPWQASYGWWMVYGTLTDIACLVVLFVLTRHEGIRVLDLLGVDRERFGKQIRYFPGYFLAFMVPVILTSVISGLFYGSGFPPQVAAVQVPLWAKIYSVAIWPVIWCFTEDIVYLGYLLPRMEVLTKRTWLAALIVVLFWAGQHLVIPFIPDVRYLISRFLTALVTVGGLTLIFLLWGRRMVPTIGVHWVSDFLSAFLANCLPRG